MRLLDTIRRSARNLRQSKLRTILTMLAISVGAFALMLTLAAGEGARQFIDRLVTSNFNPKSIYVYKLSDQTENPFAQNDEAKEYRGPKIASEAAGFGQNLLQPADLKKIAAKDDNIEKISPLLLLNVEYATKDGAKKYQTKVKSIDEGVRYEALAGHIPAELKDGQAILPEMLVQPLGFGSNQAAIGQKVTIQYSPGASGQIPAQTYTIVAVAKKPRGLLGGAREIILPQSTMQKLYEQQQGKDNPSYAAAIVFIKDPDEQRLNILQWRLLSDNYNSLSAKDLATQVTQAVNIVQYIVGGFGVVALIVSIFGIVNTQFISVLERTRQIGLMKALGMSGGGVLRLFTFEAILIGFGGALLGIFTAFVASLFLNPFLEDKLQLGGELLIFVPWQVLALAGALMLIAAVAGLLPAWKAARLNPIEALRTE